MPAWLVTLGVTLGNAALAAAMSTISAFLTEKRIRKYVVYGAQWLARKYSESEWPKKLAEDLEKDWVSEYKEDL